MRGERAGRAGTPRRSTAEPDAWRRVRTGATGVFSAEYGCRRRAPLAARRLDERRRSALDADAAHPVREETSTDPGSYCHPLIDTSHRIPAVADRPRCGAAERRAPPGRAPRTRRMPDRLRREAVPRLPPGTSDALPRLLPGTGGAGPVTGPGGCPTLQRFAHCQAKCTMRTPRSSHAPRASDGTPDAHARRLTCPLAHHSTPRAPWNHLRPDRQPSVRHLGRPAARHGRAGATPAQPPQGGGPRFDDLLMSLVPRGRKVAPTLVQAKATKEGAQLETVPTQPSIDSRRATFSQST